MFWVCILGGMVADGWVFKVHAHALCGGWVVWVLCHSYMVHFTQMDGVFFFFFFVELVFLMMVLHWPWLPCGGVYHHDPMLSA